MTSRERVTAALQHREPDRTPLFEYVLLPPVAEQLLGRAYCEYLGADSDWASLVAELGWEGAVRRYAADRVALAARLGHDLLYAAPAPGPALANSVAAPKIEDPVERVRRRTALAEERWAPPNQASFLVYECLQEEMARRGLDLPMLAPAYGHGVWTDVDLMQTLLLAPEIAGQHFALATRSALALIERYLELGVTQIGVGGDFSGTRPLISPEAYRTFVVPEVRTVSRRIHAGGGWAVNASDGDLWPVLEDFLIGCEVDGYLEIDLHAGMDLPRLKAAYGNRITFYGNMDCGWTLSFGTPEEIRQATRDCLSAGWGDGGHIFCASNAITAIIPLANYLAMVNAYREFWSLPAFA